MVDFSKYKTKGAADQLKKAREAAQAENKNSGGKKDDRFWKPTFDKEKGTGSAIVRFLPGIDEGDDIQPWVKIYHRSFKGKGKKWYIELDPSTIGRDDDPVYNLTGRLWDSGIDSDGEVAKAMKRKTKFIANVLVVKDPANRENEGKVFLYEFGSQVFEIITKSMVDAEPDEDDEDYSPEKYAAKDPFNPFHGHNLKIKMVAKQLGKDTVPDYKDTEFSLKASAIAETDDEVIKICESAYSLRPFIDPKKFKSQKELQKILVDVLGTTIGSGIEVVEGWAAATKDARRTEEDDDEVTPPARPRATTRRQVEEDDEDDMPAPRSRAPARSIDDDEDDVAPTRPRATTKARSKEEDDLDAAMDPSGSSGDEDNAAFMRRLMGQ